MAKDKDTQKVSIRFYNDREVRAVWSEENQKWFYSVLDVIGAFNMQDDYEKNRNYWKYLKAKLKKESSQVVSATTQLKLKAPDGKRRLSDVMDWSKIDKKEYLNAMRKSVTNDADIRRLLAGALTDEIDSREIFMKGIDYSYYYEQED